MKQILSVIVAISLTTTMISSITATAILQLVSDAHAQQPQTVVDHSKFASAFATSGSSVYVVWWSNKTTHSDIMFRASSDGKTFGNKINLSNAPATQSYHPEIAASGKSVYVIWWEQPNQNLTNHTAVMRISHDNGKTFGSLLKLAANGTIGS